MQGQDDDSQMEHPVRVSDDALLQNCVIRRFRHSGPGGQHRNKVETAIELIEAKRKADEYLANQINNEDD